MNDRPFDHQNAAYAQALYELYSRNPQSVPEAWRRFFAQGPEVTAAAGLLIPDGLSGNGSVHTFAAATSAAATSPKPAAPPSAPPASPAPASAASTTALKDVPAGAGSSTQAAPGTVQPRASVAAAVSAEAAAEVERIKKILPLISLARQLVQAFRDHGHMLARVEPLGSEPPGHPQLDPRFFGTTLEEIEAIPASVVMRATKGNETLGEALRRLQKAYAGHIGYEFEHMEDPTRVRWLWDQVESGVHTQPLSGDEKVKLLDRLTQVEGFEHFIHRTYLGAKRFSVEGTDALIPLLDVAIEEAARDGAKDIVLGMAHRGRLNALAHVVGIRHQAILREFEGVRGKGPLNVPGTGDVKYHHGAEGEYELAGGGSIHVTLVPNPSHLEYVNPVAMGMTRSMQFGSNGHRKQDVTKVVTVLIHGDAAFAGQGVVAESLNLARLAGYTVGGSVHIIVNNQVGFTTNPSEGRSTRYASDLAKGFDFPILHVNADEPEACLAAMRLAMAYRAKYHDDVVIDLIGYRRHGHNEGDEPTYTQPELYAKIAKHPTARRIWADRLVKEGLVTEEDVRAMEARVADHLRKDQEEVQASDTENGDLGPPPPDKPVIEHVDTNVAFDILKEINEAALTAPDGFRIHPKLKRQLDKRRDKFSEDASIEWAHAETLAFGSLLREGFVIRLSGQDAQRGTFSQRHMVLHDANNGSTYTPLTDYGQGRFEIYNSPLSEAAVLGYEYGYGVATERDLVLWEAQFGDFMNSAQVAIDQFIASGREKWDQLVNMGLLLPHGYEGQGPEHSSARLERFLTLCAEGNLRVLYPTTPAQYFHVLRRQAHVRPERPMVVMTPKSLLRLPAAMSSVRELVTGHFQPVIADPTAAERKAKVRRLILCTGKIYYDLDAHEMRTSAEDVAIGRVEQLYPFPAQQLEDLVNGLPHLEEVVWAQEEPRNMGALTFVGPRLRAVVPRKVPLRYVARPERASPAEGKPGDHNREQQRILREALGSATG
jgi:2-oxoglutarate dehydrogenase E1 component